MAGDSIRKARLKAGLVLAAIALAGLIGGLVALSSYKSERSISAGTVSLSVSPFHRGSLDLYVPVVDWGVRFAGVRMPARLQVEVRSVDRAEAARLAETTTDAVSRLRAEARDGIAAYLRRLALICALSALVLGGLVAAALRSVVPLRRRWLLAPAAASAVLWLGAVGLALAPRGKLEDPSYYAHGSDIPVALQAVESIGRTPGQISGGFRQQIVGLARLVVSPGDRPDLSGSPRLVVASDLHNNVLLEPTLRTAAAGAPVFFAGDLTDRGSPLETGAIRPVVESGHPFVFTAGNHDSDTLSQSLAGAGAVVLTQDGRLRPDGSHGATVVRVRGLRVAGYSSPNERSSAEDYRDHGAEITREDQRAFARWLLGIRDRVDLVMVHEPSLVEPLLPRLRREGTPLLMAVGHTHRPAVDSDGSVTVVNGGTLGAGGTGNLPEGLDASLAIVSYAVDPFDPLAVDLVTLDPGTGETTARRLPLGEGPIMTEDVDTAFPGDG